MLPRQRVFVTVLKKYLLPRQRVFVTTLKKYTEPKKQPSNSVKWKNLESQVHRGTIKRTSSQENEWPKEKVGRHQVLYFISPTVKVNCPFDSDMNLCMTSMNCFKIYINIHTRKTYLGWRPMWCGSGYIFYPAHPPITPPDRPILLKLPTNQQNQNND